MRTLLLAICLSTIPGMAADIYIFTVPAADNVSGPGGVSLTGWGYSITNESNSLWLVTNGLVGGPFQDATPELLFDFPDIAPGATITVPYDPSTPAGLFEITWDANTPQGFVNSGMFNVTAQWWTGDPLNGGIFFSTAPSANQPYTAVFASAPEPSTLYFGLLLLPLALAHFIRRRTGFYNSWRSGFLSR